MTCARWTRLACLTSAGALLLSTAASAQDTLPAPANPEVIVTATRLPEPLATTPDAYVITDADIQARQAVFAADVLSTVPGLLVSQTGAFGGLTSVSIRGASSDKTLVLIDGVPVNDVSSPSGGFDFGSFDLGDISRIEVLTGPQGALWGSDAIGGVIAFTTREPNGVSASLEGGSFDTWRATASAGQSNSHWALGASFAGFATQGVSAADQRNGNHEPDGADDVTVDLRGRFDVSDAVGFDGRVRYSRSRTDIDGFPPPDFLLADTNDVSVSESAEAFGRVRIAGPWGLKSELSVSDDQIERGDHGESGDFGNVGNAQVYRWTAAKGTPDDPVSVIVGAERENTTASISTGARFNLGASSGFAIAQWKPLSRLTTILSVRYDAPDRFKAQATIRAGATYDLGAGFSAQGSFDQGFKTPTISEAVCDFCFATPAPLQPEHGQGYDGGLAWRSPDGRVSLKATAYHLDVTDQIAFVDGRYINIAHTRSQGVEAEANAALGGGFSLRASYGYTDAVNADTGVRLLRVPLNTGSASLFWKRGRVDAAFTVRGEDNDLDTGLDGFTRVIRPGFVVADLAGGYALNDHVRLTARIENLAGGHYEEVFGYGEPGRAIYVGIRLKD